MSKSLKCMKDWNRQVAIKQEINKKSIIINGKYYDSLVSASRGIGVTDTTMKRLHDTAVKSSLSSIDVDVNIRTKFNISIPKD